MGAFSPIIHSIYVFTISNIDPVTPCKLCCTPRMVIRCTNSCAIIVEVALVSERKYAVTFLTFTLSAFSFLVLRTKSFFLVTFRVITAGLQNVTKQTKKWPEPLTVVSATYQICMASAMIIVFTIPMVIQASIPRIGKMSVCGTTIIPS